ncbi:hypothetical protein NC651_025216 [Populus alba x Populus x berolinensis]|nr:hypothetical protein NC651_025216 [Populus alba x Populus x berolinensis]
MMTSFWGWALVNSRISLGSLLGHRWTH